MELKPVVSVRGREEVGKSLIPMCPTAGRNKCGVFDEVMAEWLQLEIKFKQSGALPLERQPDIIITFSQWAKDLARLGGIRMAEKGKGRGQLARSAQGHTERDDGWPLSSKNAWRQIHLPMGAAQYNVLIMRGMAFQRLPAGKYHRELPWDNI